ncbi:hypothetical protein AKJ09_05526 [Labilithrix luteola]|uniref:Uncharacterized protein n=1 Tax=Labilithrix luteola TaxID=1391654 RepID=A0A0K1PZE1_9BACT|nr:hypothetical protein [Labilithrix luteola]AKU98862.1 hypothetical protein AKJ09_05526 [Labilithrix luteola]
MFRALLAWIVAYSADVRVAHAQEQAAGNEHPVRFALTLEGEGNPLESCGGAQAVRDAVEHRLRRTVFTDAASADRYFVVGGSRPTFGVDWTTRIVELDRHDQEVGRREVVVPGDECAKAVEAVAVVLSITIGPPRMVPGPVPGTERPSPPSPPPPPVVREEPRGFIGPPPPPVPAAPPHRWEAIPLLELEGGSGIQPGVSWGVGLGVQVRPPVPRVSLLARAQYWPNKSNHGTPEAEFDRLTGVLLGCYDVYRAGQLTLATCAGGEVGRLHADVPRVTRSSDQVLLVNLVGEVRLGYVFGRGPILVEPLVAANVAAVLQRDLFTFRNRDGQEATLLQPAPIAVQGAVGVAVHFF